MAFYCQFILSKATPARESLFLPSFLSLAALFLPSFLPLAALFELNPFAMDNVIYQGNMSKWSRTNSFLCEDSGQPHLSTNCLLIFKNIPYTLSALAGGRVIAETQNMQMVNARWECTWPWLCTAPGLRRHCLLRPPCCGTQVACCTRQASGLPSLSSTCMRGIDLLADDILRPHNTAQSPQ